MNKSNLEIHVRVVLEREFIEKHAFEECWEALQLEIESMAKSIRPVALAELEKIKSRNV